MDAKIEAKWVAALRSGDAQQARYVQYLIKTGMLGWQTVKGSPKEAQLLALTNDLGTRAVDLADWIEANI